MFEANYDKVLVYGLLLDPPSLGYFTPVFQLSYALDKSIFSDENTGRWPTKISATCIQTSNCSETLDVFLIQGRSQYYIQQY